MMRSRNGPWLREPASTALLCVALLASIVACCLLTRWGRWEWVAVNGVFVLLGVGVLAARSSSWDASHRKEPKMTTWVEFDGIAHRDGVPWYNAPVHRRWQRHVAQTRGERVLRCACGAFGPAPWTRLDRWPKRKDRRGYGSEAGP